MPDDLFPGYEITSDDRWSITNTMSERTWSVTTRISEEAIFRDGRFGWKRLLNITMRDHRAQFAARDGRITARDIEYDTMFFCHKITSIGRVPAHVLDALAVPPQRYATGLPSSNPDDFISRLYGDQVESTTAPSRVPWVQLDVERFNRQMSQAFREFGDETRRAYWRGHFDSDGQHRPSRVPSWHNGPGS